MTVLALDGVIRRYDWGSRTAIAQLRGVEPDGRPAAELWFGAHPDDPSGVPARDLNLDALIEAEPAAALGPAVVERFGPRLPFLLKLLAAEKALSIQVHPTLEQARAGFAAEDAAGIARGDARRNYRDANHKPELLCALTDFEALCGFRPVAETLELLEAIDVPELGFLAELLRGDDPLRAAFTTLLNYDDPPALAAVVARRASSAEGDPLRGSYLAAQHFPDDIGVVLALLLNYVRLAPGEAIYLGAGNLHAYLRGLGVEILANSDNVLRCGLTAKHIDIDALLAITEFAPLDEPRWPMARGAFEVPVADFRLTNLDVDAVTGLDDAGPSIVLCVRGNVRVGELALAAGHAAFVPAGERTTIAGAGQVFVAGVGRV